MAKRAAPEVNAGSMADIAFLLLIFFLVTTTMEKDYGINRKLPPIEDSEEDVIIKQKNIFTVLLNNKDQMQVEDELMQPDDFILFQNYPNPFNPTTKIKFQIPNVASSFSLRTTLKVYDVLGNEIAVLVNEEKPSGTYEVEFDASQLPSGVYMYRLTAGNFSSSKKLLLLK